MIAHRPSGFAQSSLGIQVLVAGAEYIHGIETLLQIAFPEHRSLGHDSGKKFAPQFADSVDGGATAIRRTSKSRPWRCFPTRRKPSWGFEIPL